MIPDLQIMCITKNDHYDPHERIIGIGGRKPNGQKWYLAIDEAIEAIEHGQVSFHTGERWSRAEVIVATHLFRKYLKTEADGIDPNNLLSLPPCL